MLEKTIRVSIKLLSIMAETILLFFYYKWGLIGVLNN